MHVRTFDASKDRAPWSAEITPSTFGSHNILFRFHTKEDDEGGSAQYFSPGEASEVESWLKPMVAKAEKKGADWLVCRVPGWDGLDAVVERCFRRVQRVGHLSFITEDTRLRGLAGIVLFARYDVFRLVNRGNSDPARRLVA